MPGALPGEPRGPARRSHACTCGNRGAEHPERTASPSRNTAQEAPPPRQPPRAGGADTHRTHTAARTALCPQPAPSRPQGTLHTHTHRRRTAARPGNCSGLPRRGRSRTLAGGRTSGNERDHEEKEDPAGLHGVTLTPLIGRLAQHVPEDAANRERQRTQPIGSASGMGAVPSLRKAGSGWSPKAGLSCGNPPCCGRPCPEGAKGQVLQVPLQVSLPSWDSAGKSFCMS